METMRSRAKEHLPHVLLTLLSIIQALALELFWSNLKQIDGLLDFSWQMLGTWVQAFATFLGILVIWVTYATTVMRFRWVPGISDSTLPFLIGLLQFILIENLGEGGSTGVWFICLAVIFAIMHGDSHLTMRRARRDPDNQEFFGQIAPATIRDFAGQIIMIIVLSVLGAYLLVQPGSTLVAGIGFAASTLLLIWHLVFMSFFWRRTMGELTVES